MAKSCRDSDPGGRAPSTESTSRSTSEGSSLHLLELALDES